MMFSFKGVLNKLSINKDIFLKFPLTYVAIAISICLSSFAMSEQLTAMAISDFFKFLFSKTINNKKYKLQNLSVMQNTKNEVYYLSAKMFLP